MSSNKMTSLHRLSKADFCDKEGSRPLIVHQPDPEPFGITELLVLLGWILRLQLDCDSFRRLREDDVYMSL